MAKHLLKFNNEAEYNAATINKPAVSWCVEENTVKYDPYVPPYVEIAGIKWAKMNVGAETETDYGLFFQWGDISGYTASQVGSGEGKKYFGWADYKYSDGGSSPSNMTKYNFTDGKKILDLEDDAARANMGEGWRMPTSAEWKALGEAVTTAWTEDYQDSGVSGVVLTSTADTNVKLFFPAAGRCFNGGVKEVGTSGYYWSSSPNGYPVLADFLYTNIGYCSFENNHLERYYGFLVRGVLDSAS